MFNFLRHSLPESFVEFLELPTYDLHYLMRSISAAYFDASEQGAPTEEVKWTPLELHAISERLKTPRPPEDSDDERHGFVNVADLSCQLKSLEVSGNSEKFGRSNIIPDKLRYDFSAFKSLTKLVLNDVDVDPEKIATFALLRKTLTHLTANRCSLTAISNLLLGDTPFLNKAVGAAEGESLDNKLWKKLGFLNLRENSISEIDDSINLCPNLRMLLFGANKLQEIDNLHRMTHLSTLEVADNSLESVEVLHMKLGQITRLDLSNNRIRSLNGCSKLYSLLHLNASGNKINDLESVFPLNKLPNLENLNLQGNPVTTAVDYRIKVFESFGKRCSDLCLDNELPTQQEIDKVSVLMALRVAREGKSPTSLFGNLPKRA